MAVRISYAKKKLNKSSSNLVLFVDEKFNVSGFEKDLSKSEYSYISELLKSNDLKKKLLVFEVNSKKKLFLFQSKKILKTQMLKI